MEKHRGVTACVSTLCSILLNAPIRDIDHRLIEASNAINLTNAHPTPQSIECLLPSSSGVRLFVGEFGQYGRAKINNPKTKRRRPGGRGRGRRGGRGAAGRRGGGGGRAGRARD